LQRRFERLQRRIKRLRGALDLIDQAKWIVLEFESIAEDFNAARQSRLVG
jgi:hypothetical protein